MDGKAIRLNRLMRNGKMLCIPLDHGVTMSDIGRLSDFKKTANSIIENGASAIIIHKGLVKFLPPLKNTGLIIHLSASTAEINSVFKVIICEVEEALSLGADAVSVHINLGNDYEKYMIKDLSRISHDCAKFGMPLFVMMYVRDNSNDDKSTIASVKHSIRIAAELGADIVKIGSNWDVNALHDILSSALLPVVIAGGELLESGEFYEVAAQAMSTGIAGVSFGRNVFLSDKIEDTVKELARMVYSI